MNHEIAINPKSVLHFLLKAISLMFALHILWKFLYLFFDQYIPFISTIAWWFNMDYEGTIPSAYSVLGLFCCALLLGVISHYKWVDHSKFALHWSGLCGLFVFAGWDEATQIHEKLIDSDIALKILELLGLEAEGIFAFGNWIVVVFPLISLLGLLYLKFYFSLPKQQRYLFLISAVLFFSGAFLAELIGSWVWYSAGESMYSMAYAFSTGIEESLEKLGVATFIYALLLYIENGFKRINLNF